VYTVHSAPMYTACSQNTTIRQIWHCSIYVMYR